MAGSHGDVSLSFDTAPNLTNAHQRRMMHPHPNHLDPRPTTGVPYGGPGMAGPATTTAPGGSGMAFMNFDLGSSSGNFGPPLRSGVGGVAFGSSSFEDEPPLLEELGINIPLIMQKLVSVLNPFRPNSDLHDQGDLSGPLVLCVLFGLTQLLSAKVHFGVILGWSAVASAFIYAVINLLLGSFSQPQSSGLDLYACCSLFGYSLLPLLVFSSLSLLLPHGIVSFVIGACAVMWSARSCSFLLVSLVPHAEDFRFLVLYSCAVVYSAFSLLILF